MLETLSKEEIRKEKNRQRYHNLSPEGKREWYERKVKWRANATPEQKAKERATHDSWIANRSPEKKAIDNAKKKEDGRKNKDLLLLNGAKYRAKKNNIPFNIDRSDIVIPTHCPILGIELKLDNDDKTAYNSPTLDKIDNSKGYIKGNVWVISMKANTMKNDASRKDLILFSKSILKIFGDSDSEL